ncbi:MAG: YncE family protein [Thermoanaerobaculia bacterium]
MILEQIGEVQLPVHEKPGGFDHAAVHGGRGRLYVAHTANNALDVVDCATNTYLGSVSGLEGVAGALVSEEHDLVFTSNRAENTVGIFPADRQEALVKVKVGGRPNGLAYDVGRRLLLAANVGDPARPGSFSVSMVDVAARAMVADVPVSGRTRWTVFDAGSGCFYVNIADPPQIAVIDAANPGCVAHTFTVSADGPHGLDLDAATGRLFCACDGKMLLVLDSRSGVELAQAELAGVPDVIFFNRERRHLYVAIGEPGLIEVFDTDQMRRLETVRTEAGAHTLGFDPSRSAVYAFLPHTHRAVVYADRG